MLENKKIRCSNNKSCRTFECQDIIELLKIKESYTIHYLMAKFSGYLKLTILSSKHIKEK